MNNIKLVEDLKYWEHRKVIGVSLTKEEAALSFVEGMRDIFPKEKGNYIYSQRLPLAYEINEGFDSGKIEHAYIMRISFKEIEDA